MLAIWAFKSKIILHKERLCGVTLLHLQPYLKKIELYAEKNKQDNFFKDCSE